MLHVAIVNHSYVPCQSGKELVQLLFSITDWARAISGEGVNVSVITRFHRNEEWSLDGVDYFFIEDSSNPLLRSYQPAWKFHKKAVALINSLNADVVHLHNPLAIGANFAMARLLKHQPVLIQDHAGVQQITRTWLLRRSLSFVDKVVFAAPGQEQCWIDQGVLTTEKVGFVMENSSSFQEGDRAQSRLRTGMHGSPVFLWVGNLTENKDPFTVLKAFAQILVKYPEAKLYMIYKETRLEKAVFLFLEDNDALKKSVKLFGPKERTALEQFYNSADYFVLASHKEGSGYSAIEAISCGAIPVLSDIPSFRQITNHEEIGCLFEAGNSEDLANRVLQLLKKPLKEERGKTVAYFNRELSFSKIASQMIAYYREILVEK